MATTKTVGIVAPSGFLPDASTLDRATQFFAARGWRMQAGETCLRRHQRFAGPDELRAAELQRFATDRSLDALIAARGGYGLSRILDRLDFAAIRKAGRFIVGYSDFTAFNLAYLARADGVSFQGPAATDFGAESPDEFTVEQFFHVLDQRECSLAFAAEGPDCEVEGRLWGGNLAIVCALLGTPYFPPIRDGILFLEDVNEPAYKVERMLLQLTQAGVLRQQRALLVGSFEPITPMPHDNGFDLAAALAHVAQRIGIPVVTGLPFGHVARKACLPVGAQAALRVRAGSAALDFPGFPGLH
jgi:muramoyltetrapeptide carboxypeptidase